MDIELPFFFRSTGWSPGVRRRGNGERKLFMCPGGVFGLLNVHSSAYSQLPARRWWPASEAERLQAIPYIYLGPADVGLTPNNWSGSPEAAAPKLAPFLLEMERAEVLI